MPRVVVRMSPGRIICYPIRCLGNSTGLDKSGYIDKSGCISIKPQIKNPGERVG